MKNLSLILIAFLLGSALPVSAAPKHASDKGFSAVEQAVKQAAATPKGRPVNVRETTDFNIISADFNDERARVVFNTRSPHSLHETQQTFLNDHFYGVVKTSFDTKLDGRTALTFDSRHYELQAVHVKTINYSVDRAVMLSEVTKSVVNWDVSVSVIIQQTVGAIQYTSFYFLVPKTES